MDRKQKGNEAMARSDFGAAAQHYTAGIAELEAAGSAADVRASTLHVLYSNRAQAYINMKKFAEAVDDSTKALKLQPAFIKSHLRRATANARLAKYDDAVADMTTLASKTDVELSANGLSRADVEESKAQYIAAGKEHAAKEVAKLGERGLGLQWIKDTAAASDKRFITPSGICCEIVATAPAEQAARARSPAGQTLCRVHYHGELRDGTVFDSSYERGEPATFSPAQVIGGWTEVLQYMAEGDVWVVQIPPELAYGQRGTGPIPGNAALQFKIELVEVMDAASSKPAAEARQALQSALGVDSLAKFLPA